MEYTEHWTKANHITQVQDGLRALWVRMNANGRGFADDASQLRQAGLLSFARQLTAEELDALHGLQRGRTFTTAMRALATTVVERG